MAETVPGVASLQARTPARREFGRGLPAVGPAAKKDRSPKVFNLKGGKAKLRESDDQVEEGCKELDKKRRSADEKGQEGG